MKWLQDHPAFLLFLHACWSAGYAYVIHTKGPTWPWLTGKKVVWMYFASLIFFGIILSGVIAGFSR